MEAAALLQLSPAALRSLYAFVHAPGEQAHVERLKSLLDDEAPDVGNPWLHQAIRERLGLGDAPEFDPADPLHRAALLPREALAALARRLGLACAAERLRRVIRRADLVLLGNELSERDWQFILAQARSEPGDGGHPLARTGLPELPDACCRLGWGLLDGLCEQLPPDLGKRLRLKLPPAIEPPARGTSGLSGERLAATCVATAREWDPDWDAAWTSVSASA